MKLYMIRLENGDATILQAESEEQAIEFAGLRADVEQFARDMSEQSGNHHDPAEIHLSLVESGTGPQSYTIRELNNFASTWKLTDKGDFEGSLQSDECANEFWEAYPLLNEVFNTTFPDDLPGGNVTREQYTTAIKNGVERERSRLTVESLNRSR